MSAVRPDIDRAGFAEALSSKRQQLGSDVVFVQPPSMIWPSGTAINPSTGDPYDPMVDPLSSAGSSATVRCGVFFKAVNRGGAEHATVDSEIGLDKHTRVFAIAPIEAKPLIDGAAIMVFHDEQFQIQAIKEDEVILGYRRLLVYAAAEG